MDVDGFKVQISLSKRNTLPTRPVRSRLAPQNTTTDIIAKIRLVPKSKHGTAITTFIHYQEIPQGLCMLHPTISIGMTLPKGSPVFLAVESGDLSTLQRLLAEGKCTLRDRDTYGTPLLHYAMEQPGICKFLIENGADIDELARPYTYTEYVFSPLASSNHTENDLGHDWTDFSECRKLLFSAGADPTLKGSNGKTLLFTLAVEGTVQFMRDLLVLGMPFINLEERNTRGQTPFMILLSGHAHTYQLPVAVRLFIEKGADIHARDSRGRTCLHIAVMYAGLIFYIEETLHTIILLIQHGADILATDFSGRSIFEDAYECNHKSRWPQGSARGDIWDAVLVRCGLGEHIYAPGERKYHFTGGYKESMFRALWKGYENLCPYPPGTSSPCPFMIMDTESELESEEEEEEEEENYLYDNHNDSDEADSDEQRQDDISGNRSSSEEDDEERAKNNHDKAG